MGEMVNRVAQALGPYVDTPTIGGPPFIVGLARAAIAAMREPTDAMMQAGMNVGSFPMCHGEVEVRWQTMIDAALNPTDSLSTSPDTVSPPSGADPPA